MDIVRTWGTVVPGFFSGEAGAALGLIDAVPELADAMAGTRARSDFEGGTKSWTRSRR